MSDTQIKPSKQPHPRSHKAPSGAFRANSSPSPRRAKVDTPCHRDNLQTLELTHNARQVTTTNFFSTNDPEITRTVFSKRMRFNAYKRRLTAEVRAHGRRITKPMTPRHAPAKTAELWSTNRSLFEIFRQELSADFTFQESCPIDKGRQIERPSTSSAQKRPSSQPVCSFWTTLLLNIRRIAADDHVIDHPQEQKNRMSASMAIS